QRILYRPIRQVSRNIAPSASEFAVGSSVAYALYEATDEAVLAAAGSLGGGGGEVCFDARVTSAVAASRAVEATGSVVICTRAGRLGRIGRSIDPMPGLIETVRIATGIARRTVSITPVTL